MEAIQYQPNASEWKSFTKNGKRTVPSSNGITTASYFSAPFRRLQNKNTGIPLPGSIFVHNRLTHSLEVSCVGRSLGNDVAKQSWNANRNWKVPSCRKSVQSYRLLAWRMTQAIRLSGIPANGLSLRSFQKEKDKDYRKAAGRRATFSDGMEDLTHFEGNANASASSLTSSKDRRRGGFVLTYSTLASIVKYPFHRALQAKIQVRLLCQ